MNAVFDASRVLRDDLEKAKAFERLQAHRIEFVEPAIAAHRGGIFKLMGDGLLAEFASVVDAVECAVDILRGMAERNSGEPEDQRIDLTSGGPSIDPELMIRMLIVGYCFGIPKRCASSERIPGRFLRKLQIVHIDSKSPP